MSNRLARHAITPSTALLFSILLTAPAAAAERVETQATKTDSTSPQRIVPTPHPTLDRSGRKQIGKASYYADFFAGRKMANGERFRIDGNNAASRTLPFGTMARVTNLENGRSAVVVIKDRGPYVEGRIVDVSPGTAEQLDMVDDGVVAVEVVPIVLPPAGGTTRRGTDVADANAAR